MLSYSRGKIIEIIYEDKDITKVKVDIGDRISDSINYNKMTGKVNIDDIVVINTTAVDLKLGTGGIDFIINNLNNEKLLSNDSGHIMKLRYTPMQIKCLAAESQESEYHNVFLNFDNLNNHICIVATLHSMLAPIVTTLKYLNNNLNINYIMTDGGCLPMGFSDTVRRLKDDKLLNNTITIGHAFGGDLEAVNIYNGLIASKEILKSDITIISMGPGIVGTGTKFGYSGIEQGEIVNAVESLGGNSILVPRVNFNDKRERHCGLSHHTRTVLEYIVKSPTRIVFNNLKGENRNIINKQLEDLNLNDNINIVYGNGSTIYKAMEKYGYNTLTMGRDIEEERDYFLTLGAVAEYANFLFNEEEKECL